MKNKFVIKIKEKYFNKLIRYSIYSLKIIKKKDYYYLVLDENNFSKINKYKDLFEIEYISESGLIHIYKIIKSNFIFLIFFILSIFYLTFLSNIIFDIEIKTNDIELKKYVLKELNKRNISKLHFIVSFSKKEKIRKDILDKNKDIIEWLEITRYGSKYIVNVEKRIKKEFDNDNYPQNIIASKNAIILSIKARNGSIVKKLNDYVKKGEVIVSGEIVHNEEIVNKVKADAIIYGETWYNVHISYPTFYYEKTYTNNKAKRLNINFINKNIYIGKKYKNEDLKNINLFNNKMIPISINFQDVKEAVITDDIYTIEEGYEKALEVARSELLKHLDKDSKILDQKKLKLIVNNSTIDIDIFFKVYENITEIKKIEE